MAEQQSAPRTLWHWMSWVGGGLFVLSSLGFLSQGHGIAALAVFSAGALLLPPVRAWIDGKTDHRLSGWAYAGCIVGLLVIGGTFLPPPEETAQAPQQQVAEEEAPQTAAPAVAAEVFTEENLRSYRVFEKLKPGKDFHKMISDDNYVRGEMTFWEDGDDSWAPGMRLEASMSRVGRGKLRPQDKSSLEDECELNLGVQTEEKYLLPQYDDAVGEQSYSKIICSGGPHHDSNGYTTVFVRGGTTYVISITAYSQGPPSDLSFLDTTVEVARDWAAKIQARAKQEVRV